MKDDLKDFIMGLSLEQLQTFAIRELDKAEQETQDWRIAWRAQHTATGAAYWDGYGVGYVDAQKGIARRNEVRH